MDINVIRGLVTLVAMLGFLGVCFSVYRPSRRAYFEEASNLPFLGEHKQGDDNE